MNRRNVAILAALAAAVCFFTLHAEAQALDKVGRACAASKLKATAKKVTAKMKCEALAVTKQLPATDSDCLAKAESKFLLAFGKAEEKGGCVSEGDAAAVESSVDGFVSDEVMRQTTGSGDGLPACNVVGAGCGSCAGGGVCIPIDSGIQVCLSMSGSYPFPCVSDAQCNAGMHCVSIQDSTGCVYACP